MRAQQPTEVCFTVDTEFSIGGNFYDPELSPVAEPVVLGMVGGKEHGLGFLLDSFSEFGVQATFFVEALQTAYFGDEPMGRIARRIAAAGHDVQLHLHPCWLDYEPAPEGRQEAARNDSCAGRSDTDLDRFFQSGLSAFSRWGLPRPVAVRTGNFQVDTNFYRAAARAGVTTSSSVAVGAWRPGETELSLTAGRHRIGQVLELPVFSHYDRLGYKKRSRILSITGCSYAEILSVLRQARHHRISPVVIVTHPQEFIKRRYERYVKLPLDRVNQNRLKRALQYHTLRRNRVNQRRLKAVLQFLSQTKSQFATVPISAISKDDADTARGRNHPISVSLAKTIARTLENGINDRIWRY